MESVLPARPDYARLDDSGSPVRLRLNSTAIRVRHDGDPERARVVDIVYVRGRKVHGVRAHNCVMAYWNAVVPYLMPELPAEQKDALAYPVKVPLMYTNAFIRNWRSFKKLGISRISCPAMYHTSCRLDTGVSIGGYECPTSPDEPIVLHMVHHPNTPGLPRREQHRLGMRDMLTTPFETIEYETRQQLARALEGGGFDRPWTSWPLRQIDGRTATPTPTTRWRIRTCRMPTVRTSWGGDRSGRWRSRMPTRARRPTPTSPSTRRIAPSRN